MATLPAVTGSIDGVKPIYEPEARWCMWNMKEIFTGTVGANRYVPKVNDWVVDTLARTIYSVLAIDPMTLLVTMEPVDNTGLSSLDGDRGANHLVYLDTSVVPHALAVDARFRIPGTMNTYIKIFRGTDVSAATGKVISFLFDASGNFVTNNIPLELAELDTHTNVSIKVPVPCHTKEALADGELVTVHAVPRRRAGAAITGLAEVGAQFQRTGRQPLAGGSTGRQALGAGRQVDYHPVPPAGAGWGIRVVAGHDKTLGSHRDIVPRQMRRNIIPLISHPVENMAFRQLFAVAQILTGDVHTIYPRYPIMQKV
mgnify:CR=1 FL=1